MTPDELFSVDLDGQRQSFDDLVADGLDRDYSARFPALRELIGTGAPRDQLFAAAMLASWAQREGYEAIVTWARAPERVPWTGVVSDRFGGADAGFAMLANAIQTAEPLPHAGDLAALRLDATRALLAIYHRVFFDRDLYALLDIDDALAKSCKADIERAIERATQASTQKQPFDMASQAAFLVGPLARQDDTRAAAAAAALLALHPQHDRLQREVAFAMRSGTGPATLVVLESLMKTTTGSVRTEAEEAIDRRRGKVVS